MLAASATRGHTNQSTFGARSSERERERGASERGTEEEDAIDREEEEGVGRERWHI